MLYADFAGAGLAEGCELFGERHRLGVLAGILQLADPIAESGWIFDALLGRGAEQGRGGENDRYQHTASDRHSHRCLSRSDAKDATGFRLVSVCDDRLATKPVRAEPACAIRKHAKTNRYGFH